MNISSMSHIVKGKSKLVLPFLNATFGTDMLIIFVLWPLWWILGIEQLFLPFFLIWEMMRYIIQNNGRIKLHPSVRWAVLLALWWIVPIPWVDRDHLDIFLKEITTAWSQVLILTLFWNALKTRQDWFRMCSGLVLMSIYHIISSMAYISGFWRRPIISVMGILLPASLIESSEFFKSISIRYFGMETVQRVFFTIRVSGFALQVSGLSIICLLLLPFVYWRLVVLPGFVRKYIEQMSQPRLRSSRLWLWLGGLILWFGLFVIFIFTESRTAYFAFSLGLTLFLVLRFRLLSHKNKQLFFALLALSIALLIITGYMALDELINAFNMYFVISRSGSWSTRIKVYQETLSLLREHWIAGWGQPVRIDGLPSVYSAGTHNSYLGMLFQHGIVGLLLYLGLWFSIWRVIVKGLWRFSKELSARYFWIMMAVAMLCFNVREAAGNWWWDQSITITLWTLWGMIITAPKLLWQEKSPSQ
jgi:hypothetical protein